MKNTPTIALIGYGEVGQILARDLAKGGASVRAYDIAFDKHDSRPSQALAAGEALGAKSAAEAVGPAQLVISAVTAASTLDAARSAAKGLTAGTWYLDLNSASPGMKRDAAEVIAKAGGRYVESAVMTPVPPYGVASPMLFGGPYAAAFLETATELGFKAQVFSETYGQASAAKMCRSIMVKGVEALIMESMLTARHYGVEAKVLASLNDLLPNPDWPKLARYMISRSLEHGKRRAEEVREVARTVDEAGVEPLMSRSIAERQDWAALQYKELSKASFEDTDLMGLVDAILQISEGD